MSTPTITDTFQCECGETHDLQLNMGFSEPDFVSKLLPWDKESRCKMSPDWCIVDESLFYIRGCLVIPVKGTNKTFTWGVWSTLSIDDFDKTMELWSNPDRVREPEYKGALANTLPFYDETRQLETTVRTRTVGERPLIRVTDNKHALATDQQDGIPFEKVVQLAKLVIHGEASNPWGHLCEH